MLEEGQASSVWYALCNLGCFWVFMTSRLVVQRWTRGARRLLPAVRLPWGEPSCLLPVGRACLSLPHSSPCCHSPRCSLIPPRALSLLAEFQAPISSSAPCGPAPFLLSCSLVPLFSSGPLVPSLARLAPAFSLRFFLLLSPQPSLIFLLVPYFQPLPLLPCLVRWILSALPPSAASPWWWLTRGWRRAWVEAGRPPGCCRCTRATR
jgi:hypothetical protein